MQNKTTNPLGRDVTKLATSHTIDFVIRDVLPATMQRLDEWVEQAPYPALVVRTSHHIWASGAEYRVTLVSGHAGHFGCLVADLLVSLDQVHEA